MKAISLLMLLCVVAFTQQKSSLTDLRGGKKRGTLRRGGASLHFLIFPEELHGNQTGNKGVKYG